ncbi:MAG: sialate O-acetylesterase [Bacteroidia bacterium]|nr:sialate O-acetylesterase [Bacteroidia bacterium]
MKKSLFIALALLLCVSASAKLSIKQPCSDGMVLQQNTECMVWGHASAGASVSVTTSWNGRSYNAKTDSKGVWKVYVKTPAASYTSYSIKVSGDGGSLSINNVLIGEVWLASGQSNMEMPIRGFGNCPVEGAAEVIAAPALTNKVRMLTVKIYQPDEPIDDVHETDGWLDASANTVADMSATAFFFARKLNEMLDVPVGILSFPRGGAAVESWLPKETLAAWGDDVSPEKINSYTEWTVPYRMYNGMQKPVQGYTAKGFIWYQGCTNVGEDARFVSRMTELIRQWRSDFGDNGSRLPFYMCEIAPYTYTGVQSGTAALLREAQHEVARTVDNCAIIVTNDLVYSYEKKNIHPCQKQPVGERLAYLALNRDYGFSRITCTYPEAVRAYKPQPRQGFAMGSQIWVEFKNCPNGVSRECEIEGLEIVAKDGSVVPVTEARFQPEIQTLFINCSDIDQPVEIRYGWGDFKPGNLKSVEGLPFTPFRISVQN